MLFSAAQYLLMEFIERKVAHLKLRDETSFLNFFFKKYWSKMIYFIKFLTKDDKRYSIITKICRGCQ